MSNKPDVMFAVPDEGCAGLTGVLFGHKFEDVFEQEKGTPHNMNLSETVMIGRTADDIAQIILAATPIKERYIHTVCRRCGRVVVKKVSP